MQNFQRFLSTALWKAGPAGYFPPRRNGIHSQLLPATTSTRASWPVFRSLHCTDDYGIYYCRHNKKRSDLHPGPHQPSEPDERTVP
jgi:hypothetical protein